MGSAGRGDHAFTESDGSLFDATDATLDHEPVFVDLTIVREAPNRRDALLCQIRLTSGGVVNSFLANTQDSLVYLSTVVVALLTGTRYGSRHAGRMPGADAGNLAQATVGLTR